MIFLQSFQMPTRIDEENYFFSSIKAQRTCYTTNYPFNLFRYRELPEFYFTDTLWPDLKTSEVDSIIENFKQRNRRFGGVNDTEA